MSTESKKIFILPFPQYLKLNEGGKSSLITNVVILPRNDPFENLVEDITVPPVTFANANFTLKAWLVKGGSEELPNSGDHSLNGAYFEFNNLVLQDNDRGHIFNSLENEFEIVPTPIPAAPGISPQPVVLKKYLPLAYRDAFSFRKPRNSNAVVDDSYFCSLKENAFPKPYVRNNTVIWAQVLAFALQQPLLAKALGILYSDIEIPLDNAKFFEQGGWIYFDFDEKDPADTTLQLTASNSVKYYAARIPAAMKSRQVFAPVLFPVLSEIDEFGNLEATVPFDDVFQDAVAYDDGFAKIVHCSQAITSDPILETKETTAPLMDTGIRLGWDDEQILAWMSRSFSDIFNSKNLAHSKLAISRYRLDVAEISQEAFESDDISITENEVANNWKSQVAVTSKSDLKIGDFELGQYEGETGVQVSPSRSNGVESRLWLPAFFSFWNGASLSVTDPIPEEINNIEQYKEMQATLNADKNAPALYEQSKGSSVDLKYGHYYAFRVRLSDLSGGGPAVTDHSLNPGENSICKHRFTRNVTPSPPTIIDEKDGLKITRPRLGYPAILFAAADTKQAIELLKEDRVALNMQSANLASLDAVTGQYKINQPESDATFEIFKKASREVSIADPDVDKVDIIVEVETLEMDRKASYNSLHAITPAEPFLFLYQTTRPFDDYTMSLVESKHAIDLKFKYRDAPVIFFNEGNDPNALGLGNDLMTQSGALILPTGRKIRLTIRSFCSTAQTDYFADDDVRFSTPVKREVSKSVDSLEPTPLLEKTSDPLLCIFFRAESAKTIQSKRAAAALGDQNQTDVNIVERLASVGGFEKNGLSIFGKENKRVQFGCSNLIGHTLSPDHSSVTFATIDDLSRKWISVIQLDLNRDWSWDMLQADSFEVFRQWKYQRDDMISFENGREEKIGVVALTKALNWQHMPEPDRFKTRLVFIDALDPKVGAMPTGAKQESADYPEPIEVRYRFAPRFKEDLEFDKAPFQYESQAYNLEVLLPVTKKPSQVPEIVSVGFAFSDADQEDTLFNNQYAETSEQVKRLWVEFAEPVENPDDTYFARILAYAPDPAIAEYDLDVSREMDEPAINLDPEIIRIVRPEQVKDNSGFEAMQSLGSATSAVDEHQKGIRHFLLPLPPGLTADSMELFGFFTYEFRIGHTDNKWSTAQGRFGRALRLTGIQHPAPRLRMSAIRKPETIEVSAGYAQSYFKGNICTPEISRTGLYALLYAQVLQADGKQYRNVLIDQLMMNQVKGTTQSEQPRGTGIWQLKEIRKKLLLKGMDINSPLSVLAIELMPDGNSERVKSFGDELFKRSNSWLNLENIRILRSSRLYKISDSCPV